MLTDVQTRCRLAFNREDNDCAVRAVAVACDVSYARAHAALASAGRLPGYPTRVNNILEALRELGRAAILRTPRAKTLRSMCRELRGATGGVIVITCNHAAGFWDGRCIDWARDRLLRIKMELHICDLK